MIFFLGSGRNEQPMRLYLGSYGARLARLLQPLPYARLFDEQDPPPGTYCFADLELLTEAERAQAALLWNRLAARGCRLLNHPERSRRRYELLALLHQRGTNRFGVHRPGEEIPAGRFPVFVRRENDHEGSRSSLLHTPAEVRQALDGLQHGMVVEFCDTADGAGIYRKYGAFIVGNRILARHLFFSRHWQVKERDLLERGHVREELEYVRGNPHASELREIFGAARIEYGRIDYSLCSGKIQVWEINTNPVLVGTARASPLVRAFSRCPSRARRILAPLMSRALPRAAVHARFAAELEQAWAALGGKV